MRKEDHRNEETKVKLVKAFRKLSLKKGVTKVSIADITNYCHCNRNTFYYHFEDVRYLLKWMFEQDCAKVISSLQNGDVKDLISSCIQYIQENRPLLKDAFEKLGSDSMRAFAPYFEKTIGTIIENYEAQENNKLDNNYRKFLIRFFGEAVGGMMLAYVRGDDGFLKNELIDDITNAVEVIPLFIIKNKPAIHSTNP